MKTKYEAQKINLYLILPLICMCNFPSVLMRELHLQLQIAVRELVMDALMK